MRIVLFLLSLLLTTGLIICLNTSWGSLKKTPLFGQFLSPQHGFCRMPSLWGRDSMKGSSYRD